VVLLLYGYVNEINKRPGNGKERTTARQLKRRKDKGQH
jgi:hypothetical protein